MPMPPASLTAATSSGLLQGYIAPQMSGTSMPACRVSGVSSGRGFTPLDGREAPPHGDPRHDVAAGVADLRDDVVIERLAHLGRRAGALGRERAARLLVELGGEMRHDAADR